MNPTSDRINRLITSRRTSRTSRRANEDMLGFMLKGYLLLAIIVALPVLTFDFIRWVLK